ncbi:hypothetical protein L6164_001691 [Bauhinia variegata]|uniref:Uncharacterized protein n=1 Tax=Bauhinia variegata TaxID=167791 RepID=A0ACB9QAE1_BAUVA|nr:hypothetical protein L6164_001691 [Bauhinia variegata]
MTSVYMFGFLIFSFLVQLFSAVNGHRGHCPPSFNCGYLEKIQFPFTKAEQPNCGIFPIQNCDDPRAAKKIQLENQGKQFVVIHVSQSSQYRISIRDENLYRSLQSRSCNRLSHNYTLPISSPLASFQILYNVIMFKCNRNLNVKTPANLGILNYSCGNYDIYYSPLINESRNYFTACSVVQLPVKDLPDAKDPFTFVTAEIPVEVTLSPDCTNCRKKKGQCRLDRNETFYCEGDNRSDLKVKLGLAIGLSSILVIGLLILLAYKRTCVPSDSHFPSRHTSADPYSNIDPESGGVYFGVPLFSYKELQEATNNFDSTRKLGNGGVGTVYYGELLDGREVAIKRLYDHNNRRVEQFMNEIEILTRLRHKNLVALHGCTSRYSHELLLVYEYIPKGTLASHLHDVIHRDVKTNNILLDNNLSVKVADFGLSRLFPNDVTHVSTAPQGTPGYVDPEYHQCYQLTSKSDVYSFGVVLIELISYMLAVDMSRHKDEINLANLAIKKIQRWALNELVDPCLNFESDNEVRRMIVSVAGVAFQCLQQEKELRPTMDEVSEALGRIASGEDEHEYLEEPSPDDEVGLLKNMKQPASPNTVTGKWDSVSTTPNISS